LPQRDSEFPLLVRPLDRRAFLRYAAAASSGAAAIWSVGCGSSSSKGGTTSTSAPSLANSSAITPELLTQEFVANQDNRFAVGLITADRKLVQDASVHLRFFTLAADGSTGTLRGEGDAQLVALSVPGAHAHDKSQQADADADNVAFYLANAPFDVAGKWGVEITATPTAGGAPATIQAPFDVRDKPQSPGLGDVPPASRNDTTTTNPDPSTLCSREPPCPLHDKVIADVLGKGRPLVVQFSTPAFCVSRFCGPVLEVLLQQVPTYQDRVDFVHIEVWQDFQLQKYRPAVTEWNLPGEPYTFFMDRSGKVVGKLEAIFSEEELTGALDNLVKL